MVKWKSCFDNPPSVKKRRINVILLLGDASLHFGIFDPDSPDKWAIWDSKSDNFFYVDKSVGILPLFWDHASLPQFENGP